MDDIGYITGSRYLMKTRLVSSYNVNVSKVTSIDDLPHVKRSHRFNRFLMNASTGDEGS